MRSTKTRPELQAWGVVLVLAAACVLCSLSVIAIQPGPLSETLSVFWADKVLFLLNGFPVCVVLLLCWCATGDPFTAAGLGSLIVNLMSYVNLVKTDCRNDPFVPDDFQLLREAMNAASEYTLDLHWPILIAIVLGSAACFVLAHFIRARKPRWYVRAAGALVLLIGLRMAGILPGLRSTETELPGACSLNARTRRRFAGRPLIIGLLTGVMPCGALSAMWLCAMSSGSAARGALVMLVFSLGTVPLLFLFGALQSFLPRGWMKYIVKGSAVLVVTLGLSMLVKGIRLFGM